MARKAPKKVRDVIDEMKSWLENFAGDRKAEYPKLVMRILATMPGGDEAEDIGFDPINGMGWHEFDLLARFMMALEGKDDVEYAVSELIGGEGEED